MTRAIVAISQAEPRFAAGFVALLFETLRHKGRGKSADSLEPVPRELQCHGEERLRDLDDSSPGRVDLRFDGDDGFTLLVENKLHSGYGDRQLQRYLDGLAMLEDDGRVRSGLVAVTRDVPGYGEPQGDKPGWLGSVRWAELKPQLGLLPLREPLKSQWAALITVMDEQGDLGMTGVKTELIEGWALYHDGRDHLADLLLQIRERALSVLQTALVERYAHRFPPKEVADYHAFGRHGTVPVKQELSRTWVGFRIPAWETERPRLIIQFSNYFSVPHFTVQAEPADAHELRRSDHVFREASEMLESAGFKTNGHYWAQVHESDEWLHEPDVPDCVARLVEVDINTVVRSGIFDKDVDTIARGGGFPPR